MMIALFLIATTLVWCAEATDNPSHKTINCGMRHDPKVCPRWGLTTEAEMSCLAWSNSLRTVMDCVQPNNADIVENYCQKVPPSADVDKSDAWDGGYCLDPRDVLIQPAKPRQDCNSCGILGALLGCPKNDASYMGCLCTHSGAIQRRLNCLSQCFGRTSTPNLDCEELRKRYVQGYGLRVPSKAVDGTDELSKQQSSTSTSDDYGGWSVYEPSAGSNGHDFDDYIFYDEEVSGNNQLFRRCIIYDNEAKETCYILRKRQFYSNFYSKPLGSNYTQYYLPSGDTQLPSVNSTGTANVTSSPAQPSSAPLVQPSDVLKPSDTQPAKSFAALNSSAGVLVYLSTLATVLLLVAEL